MIIFFKYSKEIGLLYEKKKCILALEVNGLLKGIFKGHKKPTVNIFKLVCLLLCLLLKYLLVLKVSNADKFMTVFSNGTKTN